jgi:hypothetical protein
MASEPIRDHRRGKEEKQETQSFGPFVLSHRVV